MGSYVRDTLLNGEVMIYEAKVTLWSHWLTLLIASLCLFGAFAVGTDLAMWFLGGFGLALILYVAVSLQTTELGVTNKRIVAKRGVVARHLIELKLDRIETIRISQSLTGRMLNYGSLRIAGSGNPVTPIGSISDPLEFRRVALQAQEEALAGQALHTYSLDGGGSNLLALAALVAVTLSIGLGYRFFSNSAHSTQQPPEIVDNYAAPSSSRRALSRAPRQLAPLTSNMRQPDAMPSFRSYEDGKYGYSFLVPSTLAEVTDQVNESEHRFVSADREAALVTLGGNTFGESLGEIYQKSLESAQGEVGYHVISTNWFVISSKSGGVLRYQKTFAGPGSSNTFVLTFPETEKPLYIPIINTMQKTFRHGDLASSW